MKDALPAETEGPPLLFSAELVLGSIVTALLREGLPLTRHAVSDRILDRIDRAQSATELFHLHRALSLTFGREPCSIIPGSDEPALPDCACCRLL